VFDPGLQLSFAAVAAILLAVPRVPRWAAPLAVTAAATVATAPIAWWHFGRATVLAAIPANALAAPAVPLTLWTAVAAILVTPIAPAAGAGIAWCAQWPGLWILLCAGWGARLAAATPGWLLPLVLAVAALIRMRAWPKATSHPRT
jgi:competence protein ComEC